MNSEIKKISSTIKANSQSIQMPSIKKKSYADVAGNTVVIKPKTKQDTKATRKDITKKLNPTELELKII